MSNQNQATLADAQATETSASEGSLLEQILSEARLDKSDETYSIARQGVEAFIASMLAPDKSGQRIDRAAIDAMVAEIDRRISAQVNEILHAPAFQQLESTWRELKLLVDRVDFRENIKVEILNLAKEDLSADFEDAPELVKSGLYRTVYSSEYGTFGGSPYGLLVANYDFDQGPQDMQLLRDCAAVAAMAHAPFIANASPRFFGGDSFLELPRLKDLRSLFEGPQYARWSAFRDSEDARNVGLCLPRFLLRLPYSQETIPSKSFNFQEDVIGHHSRYLWGHASVAFATRVADSFAKYRWCPNIIGPNSGGAIEQLPLHNYEAMGEVQTKIPTEIQLTERREFELSEEGFIGLVYRKGTDNAAFFSANSPQRPKLFGNSDEGRSAETNYRLGTQLPYMFIISRLAHYIKVLE
ncbi:MAG TPA: type VI secretion system contractile sheath large subunit, partial [Polyangiaceae bacterium]|nr:type VI secretion system contractile sheath large subunit [Polyangiaceae bacterium]